jgi:hypothetical protein
VPLKGEGINKINPEQSGGRQEAMVDMVAQCKSWESDYCYVNINSDLIFNKKGIFRH